MPDFQIVNNSLKVTWVRRLNDSANASWSTIPLAFLSNVGGRFLFQCNFDLKFLRVDIPIAFFGAKRPTFHLTTTTMIAQNYQHENVF